jgi:hypothetical protein
MSVVKSLKSLKIFPGICWSPRAEFKVHHVCRGEGIIPSVWSQMRFPVVVVRNIDGNTSFMIWSPWCSYRESLTTFLLEFILIEQVLLCSRSPSIWKCHSITDRVGDFLKGIKSTFLNVPCATVPTAYLAWNSSKCNPHGSHFIGDLLGKSRHNRRGTLVTCTNYTTKSASRRYIRRVIISFLLMKKIMMIMTQNQA